MPARAVALLALAAALIAAGCVNVKPPTPTTGPTGATPVSPQGTSVSPRAPPTTSSPPTLPTKPSGTSNDPLPAFLAPVLIDKTLAANEPSIARGTDGALYVSAPRGVGTASPMWKSIDGGATWARIDPLPAAGGLGAGGGDTAMTVGPDGTIYESDLYLGGITTSASADGGKTWKTDPASSIALDDRQWMAATKDGAFLLYRNFVNGQVGTFVSKSTDGGVTWLPAGIVSQDSRQNGPLVADAKGELFAAYLSGPNANVIELAKSVDAAATWTTQTLLSLPDTSTAYYIFPVVGVDANGVLFLTWADDHVGKSPLVYLARSFDSGKTWSKPQAVSSGGAAVFPWLAAEGNGHVLIAWYEADAMGDPNTMSKASWTLHYAETFSGDADEMRFMSGIAAPDPIHKGTLSTQGLSATGAGADRSLGDFFSVAFDARGRGAIVYNANPNGGTAAVAFVREA